MATATMVKKTEANKQDFGQRWNALAPGAQDRFYRMKCSEMLAPPRYSDLTGDERSAIVLMRDNMKLKMNGKEHPKMDPLMSC